MAVPSNPINFSNLSQNSTDYENDENFNHNYFIYFIFWSRLFLRKAFQSIKFFMIKQNKIFSFI